VNDSLQDVLSTRLKSEWQSNPAMHQIVDGYARFHAALAIVGGVFLLILVALCVASWIRFKKIPKISKFKWSFEKKVYFWFGTVFTIVSLFLTLIVAANISNAAKPLPGFSDSIPSMASSSYNAQLHSAFNNWIASGNEAPPSLVQQRIHERRVFHGTRAAIAIILLIIFAVTSMRLWGELIKRRNSTETKWSFKEIVWLITGIVTVAIVVLMMIVVMANLQSVIAPIANTLQFG
jgi:sensor c-di-GMP phosphodiesterase-like protein